LNWIIRRFLPGRTDPTQHHFPLKGSDARTEEIRHNALFPSKDRMQELKKSDTTPFFPQMIGCETETDPTQRPFSLKGSDVKQKLIRHNSLFPSKDRM